ncbi:homoserine dehydrogenase [Carnobacterium divergens]|uniref:Homoserine dehydrogenase n=1 Tax=Carnobacterium divergens DSM 20623 TaxID=1449336 RepID=A0A0R2HUL0_CARDV|nr:homoserine dehydrogenase [Carnobacterium divergens]ANZ99686.1 homoserine dehydrogenase [Carnobacterium divergens]KRN56312.1 homoserine dehydrogenase [Carnobacterium divergens DSM 20623]MDO0875097.1 homoserine dehydrogenase [Carnobacterium divergens]MDT1995358.1 homoserine dehydrogenase [Carnobacterium divergens]TFI65456.1 homoserine dehydrogenase [Carnobacterium divergens]
MNKQIQVGILGFGTVGSGVIRILKDHNAKIRQVTGEEISVKKVLVRDIEKNRGKISEGIQLTTNEDEVLADPEIDVILEVMGSIDSAKMYITKALKAGKHVVTANKDLIALHGNELVALAKENQCDLYYEASVAGGIPILRTIVDSLASDNIQQVMGIVNGTTNFMLTKMTNEHQSYEEALKEAQELGFAESDPTNDVDGIDAARKMVILTRLAFGMNVELDQIETKGIRNLKSIDIETAKKLGYRIKLIGTAEENNGGVSVSVGPILVPEAHPLASVQNENNAVFVVGAAVGETMFYGPGAGELPTATSVVSDLITVAKNIRLGTTGNVFNSYQHETKLMTDEEILSKYYLSIEMNDRTGLFLELTKIFAASDVGFDKIIQEPIEGGMAKVVIITHLMNRKQEKEILAKLKKADDMNLLIHLKVMEG